MYPLSYLENSYLFIINTNQLQSKSQCHVHGLSSSGINPKAPEYLAVPTKAKSSFQNKLKKYFKDMRKEVKHVIWITTQLETDIASSQNIQYRYRQWPVQAMNFPPDLMLKAEAINASSALAYAASARSRIVHVPAPWHFPKNGTITIAHFDKGNMLKQFYGQPYLQRLVTLS